jgi:hypothetical protein
MYLFVFWFLGWGIAIALLLQSFEMEKSMSGFIGLPVGIFIAYKIYALFAPSDKAKSPGHDDAG